MFHEPRDTGTGFSGLREDSLRLWSIKPHLPHTHSFCPSIWLTSRCGLDHRHNAARIASGSLGQAATRQSKRIGGRPGGSLRLAFRWSWVCAPAADFGDRSPRFAMRRTLDHRPYLYSFGRLCLQPSGRDDTMHCINRPLTVGGRSEAATTGLRHSGQVLLRAIFQRLLKFLPVFYRNLNSSCGGG